MRVGWLLLVHQSNGVGLWEILVTVARVGWVQNFVTLSFALGLEVNLGQLDLGQLEFRFAGSIGRLGGFGQLGGTVR